MTSSNTLDGYELFFNYFKDINDDRMVHFGISNMITTPIETANKEWEKIKIKLLNNKELFIRGYGRDAKGTELYFHLYNEVFNNNSIKKDGTNNHNPSKAIQKWTKHSKAPTKKQLDLGFQKIQNFQISHVFGKTKNPLLFTAPWNIIILPKVMDPFTGHEAKGELKEKFLKTIKNHLFEKYSNLIKDYNNFLNDELTLKIKETIKKMESNKKFSKLNLKKFEKDALSEWEKIA